MRIKWNVKGFYDLRREPGVVRDLESRAERIASSAEATGHGGYETSSQQGARKPQGRWRTTVITADAQAQRETAKNQHLLRNLDQGR